MLSALFQRSRAVQRLRGLCVARVRDGGRRWNSAKASWRPELQKVPMTFCLNEMLLIRWRLSLDRSVMSATAQTLMAQEELIIDRSSNYRVRSLPITWPPLIVQGDRLDARQAGQSWERPRRTGCQMPSDRRRVIYSSGNSSLPAFAIESFRMPKCLRVQFFSDERARCQIPNEKMLEVSI